MLLHRRASEPFPGRALLLLSCFFYVTWCVETVMLSRSSIPLTSVGPHRHCHSYPPVKMSVHILHGSSVPPISSSRLQHLIMFSVLKLCQIAWGNLQTPPSLKLRYIYIHLIWFVDAPITLFCVEGSTKIGFRSTTYLFRMITHRNTCTYREFAWVFSP